MKLRPITPEDAENVLRLAEEAGSGMTSLPADPAALRAKIDSSVRSMAGRVKAPESALYFFVLEDETQRRLAGTTAIATRVGLTRPMYGYKTVTETQHSSMLGLSSRHEMLHIVTDMRGVSELGSLFLRPEYRRDRMGRFLSGIRLLFIGLFRSLFDDKVIAEIRGWHDDAGNAPFYDSLARRFLQMPFSEADWICATRGNQFISELMPRHPVYSSLLPASARQAIGRAHESSVPAKAMLEREGFTYHGHIDVFDGGPTLEARTEALRTVRRLGVDPLHRTESGDNEAMQRCMLAVPDLQQFCACPGWATHAPEGLVIDRLSAETLGVASGDRLAHAPL